MASLYSYLTSTEPADQAFLDVIARIDSSKVLRRLQHAAKTSEATKVVLFQYFYTSKKTTGVPNIVTRLPSGMLLQDAFFKFDLAKRLQEFFNPGNAHQISVYRRRRTNFRNGEASRDPHVVQVVLSIAPGVFKPIVVGPVDAPSETAPSETAPSETAPSYRIVRRDVSAEDMRTVNEWLSGLYARPIEYEVAQVFPEGKIVYFDNVPAFTKVTFEHENGSTFDFTVQANRYYYSADPGVHPIDAYKYAIFTLESGTEYRVEIV